MVRDRLAKRRHAAPSERDLHRVGGQGTADVDDRRGRRRVAQQGLEERAVEEVVAVDDRDGAPRPIQRERERIEIVRLGVALVFDQSHPQMPKATARDVLANAIGFEPHDDDDVLQPGAIHPLERLSEDWSASNRDEAFRQARRHRPEAPA